MLLELIYSSIGTCTYNIIIKKMLLLSESTRDVIIISKKMLVVSKKKRKNKKVDRIAWMPRSTEKSSFLSPLLPC